MSAGFTPGPWAVCEDDSMDRCEFIPIETDQPTGPLCRLICEVRPANDDQTIEEVDRANARLIAAAPDLLVAVAAFIERWDDGSRADTDYVAGLMKIAHAKATGHD